MEKKESLFRLLRADEIECRVGSIVNTKTTRGLSLLLYKDARCDMAMLDERVTPERWQRRHYDCKGNLFCSVGIKTDSGEWIWKDDCGVESNTAAEKGEASDSFKRACVNWGIGRELYTSPFIWITDCEIETDDKGKTKCKDRFKVSEIEYDYTRSIKKLVIVNQNGVVVYPSKKQAEPKQPEAPKPQGEPEVKCSKCGAKIKPGTGKDGTKYTPSEVAGKCKGMCKHCYLEAQNES